MTRALATAWIRSFAVQGSWNYDRMVGLGLAHVMEPLLRGMPGPDGEERVRKALGRAATFFNAHPYLVGLGAGALARAAHDAVPLHQVERLKGALVASLGSVGDRLVWAGWLPVSSAAGIMATIVVSPMAGVLVFLLTYNVVHLLVRWWGLSAGWRDGIGVAAALSGPVMQVALRIVGRAAPFAVGLALPLAVEWLVRSLPAAAFTGIAVTAVVALGLGRWLAPTLGGVRVGLALVAVALLAGMLWR